jgi:hypothetical protein
MTGKFRIFIDLNLFKNFILILKKTIFLLSIYGSSKLYTDYLQKKIPFEKLDDKILRKYVRQYIDDIFVEFGGQPSMLQYI